MNKVNAFAFLSLSLLLSVKLMAAEHPKKENIIRMPLLTAHLAKEKSIKQIEVKRINFSPMQKTGVHLHPCPVVGYIAKGSIYFQVEGEQGKTLHEGDAFFEPANVKILHFDNTTETETSSFIAYYLLGNANEGLIKMLE